MISSRCNSTPFSTFRRKPSGNNVARNTRTSARNAWSSALNSRPILQPSPATRIRAVYDYFEELAEESESRTHRDRLTSPNGFEDRARHRPRFPSNFDFNRLRRTFANKIGAWHPILCGIAFYPASNGAPPPVKSKLVLAGIHLPFAKMRHNRKPRYKRKRTIPISAKCNVLWRSGSSATVPT